MPISLPGRPLPPLGRLALALLLLTVPAAARLAAGESEPESVESLFAEALAAHEARDWARYRDRVERTAALLHDPSRLLYRLGSARLLAGDRAGALAALERMIGMGFYRDPRPDPEWGALAGDPAFDALLARLDALREPRERSSEAFRLSAGGMLIEGVAYDPKRRAWYLSSVDRRRILRRDERGRVVDFVAAGAAGLAAPLGLAVDADRRRLWVVSAGLPHARGLAADALDRSALYAFDLEGGRLLERIDAPPGKRLWNDLEIARDGTIYVSDPGSASIARVRPGAGVETLTEGAGLVSPGGLALSSDGRQLYVADWSNGLARVDPATGRLEWLPAPANATTLGIDGLRLRGASLIAIQNGVVPVRVTRFDLARDGRSIVSAEVLERAHRLYDEPTLGVLVGGDLVYVANSHWPRFGQDGAPPADGELEPAILLRLPLGEAP